MSQSWTGLILRYIHYNHFEGFNLQKFSKIYLKTLNSVLEKAMVIVDGKSRRDKDKSKGFFAGLMWTHNSFIYKSLTKF